MPVNKQLQTLIENIAEEHDLSKEQLEEAIKDAILKAAQKSVTRPVRDLTVEMNKGDIRIKGKFEVVEKMPVGDTCGKIELNEIQSKADDEKLTARLSVEREKFGPFATREERKAAESARQELLKKKYAEIDQKYNHSVGDIIEWEITPNNFGRIAANNVKQTISTFIRDAERKSICDRYKKYVGQLIQCTFERTERAKVQKKDDDGNDVAVIRNGYDTIVLIDDRYEGVIPFKECVPGERFEYGERIRAVLLNTNESNTNGQRYAFTLSRASKSFVEKIIAENVTEIGDGTVEIKDIARVPGIRSKVIVSSNSRKVDPIGACLGRKGNILRSITDALRSSNRPEGKGERVDIIRYSENFEDYAKAVLKPAEVESMDLDAKNRVLTIRVAKGNNSKAIGVNGCNVSLAGSILNCKIVVQENDENWLDKAFEEVLPTPEPEPNTVAMPEPTPEFLAAKEKAKSEFKLVFGISDDDAEKLFVTGHMIVDGIESDLQALPGYQLSEDALKKINAYFGQDIQD